MLQNQLLLFVRKKNFKNYDTDSIVRKHTEDHREVNFRQKFYEKATKNTVVPDISELLVDHDYNRDEWPTVLKHALSLDESAYTFVIEI